MIDPGGFVCRRDLGAAGDVTLTLTLTVQAVSFAGVTSVLQETATEYRIDKDHANAHATWQAMGSPPKPTPEQVQKP